MYWVEYNLHPRLTWRSAAFPIKKQLLQLSAQFIWVNSSTSNCKRFHLHQTRLDTAYSFTPSERTKLVCQIFRQLLVGPQDAWRPNQRFHLLQFWPRRNEACCWPLVSSGKLMLCPLCPLCCIQGSKTQGYALTWFSHFGYQSIWSKADNLQSILRGSWGHRNCKTDRGPGPHQKDMPWKISS